MKIPLKVPMIAAAAWMIFTMVSGSSGTEILVKIGLFLVTAALAYGWWKTRTVGQPVISSMKEFGPDEKAWLKQSRKSWDMVFDTIGLAKRQAGKNPSMPETIQAPRLLSCRPVPLGIDIGIEILLGQTQSDWIAASEKLSAAWGRDVRISKGQNPRHVVVLVEFSAPLDESRDAADEWDTKDWGVRDA